MHRAVKIGLSRRDPENRQHHLCATHLDSVASYAKNVVRAFGNVYFTILGWVKTLAFQAKIFLSLHF
jgi:hypothetical protein